MMRKTRCSRWDVHSLDIVLKMGIFLLVHREVYFAVHGATKRVSTAIIISLLTDANATSEDDAGKVTLRSARLKGPSELRWLRRSSFEAE